MNKYLIYTGCVCIILFYSACNKHILEDRQNWLAGEEELAILKYCEEHPNSLECVDCVETPDLPVCDLVSFEGISHVGDAFEQVQGRNKLDIIWVVDNSGSMNNEQTALANNFSTFIADIVARDIDFKIGITTTDTTGTGGVYEDNGEFRGIIPVLSSETMSGAEIQSNFQSNIMVGIDGSGYERGLDAIRYAIQKNTDPASNNYQFIREDAFLAIIVVSDENDISPDSTASYVADILALKSNPVDVAVYSIVDTTATSYIDPYDLPIDMSIYTSAGFNNPGGLRYINLSNATGGFSLSIHEDFASSLIEIVGNLVELATRYQLIEVPETSTIRLRIEGSEVPNDPINGWTYDEATNSILFHGTYVPPANSFVEISYEHAVTITF